MMAAQEPPARESLALPPPVALAAAESPLEQSERTSLSIEEMAANLGNILDSEKGVCVTVSEHMIWTRHWSVRTRASDGQCL